MSRRKSFRLKSPRRCGMLLCAAAAAPGLLARDALADRYWKNSITSGNWSAGSNWSSSSSTGTDNAGPPGFTDFVYITNFSTSAYTVNFDENDTIGQLEIGCVGGGTDTFSQTSAFSLITANGVYVGYNGNGVVNQSAGALSVGAMAGADENLYLNYGNSSTTGVYNLSGSGSLTTTGSELVGASGAASFNQSGGTNTAELGLGLGESFGGSSALGAGTYTLNGAGTLTALSEEIVGAFGNGTFNQSAGVNNVGTSSSSAQLYLGYSSGSIGTYSLSAGTLNVYGAEYVGYSGNGTFTQSGGTHIVGTSSTPESMYLGLVSSATGTYLLSSTGSLTVYGNEYIGDGGNGTFNQTGGTHVVGTLSTPESMYVGFTSTGTGTYLLSNAGSLTVNGNEYIGDGGIGLFNQSGGTASTGSLLVGDGSTGSYFLSSGSLTTTGWEIVGQGGVGAFSQYGGTNTVDQYLVLGNSSTGTGTYSLVTAGTLNVLGNEYVGNTGNGTFIQGAGVHNIGTSSSPAQLYLAYNSGVTGTYTLNGGTLNAISTEYLGFGGAGTFNQAGGTHVVGTSSTPEMLYLGYSSGSTGTYSLNPGTLTANGWEVVGEAGAGSFTQTSGTNTANQYLVLGDTSTGTGTYSLNGAGTLNVLGNEYVGNAGAGTFNQSAGVHTIGTTSNSAELYLAYNGGTTGSYTFNGAGTLTVNGIEYVGFGGTGTFSQSNGTHTVTSGLYLGFNSNSAGTYILSSIGSLTSDGPEYIGYNGAGTFTQNDGTHIIGTATSPQVLYLGYAAGSTGVYTLLVGSTLTVNGTEAVGGGTYSGGGSGTFTQNGGNQTIGSLVVGFDATGTFNLMSGTLSETGATGSGEFIGQQGGTATFNQSGGTHLVGTATTLFNLNVGSGGTGTYLLSNGSLTIYGTEFIGGSGSTGAFSQSGGTQTIGTAASPQGLYIGSHSPGTYSLTSSGSLTVFGAEFVGLDPNGAGTFQQMGGTQVIGAAALPENLFIGGADAFNVTGGSGTYLVSGSGSLTVTGNLYVAGNPSYGAAGTGSLTVGGTGSVSVSSILELWSTGTLAVGGGTLTVTGGLLNAGIVNITGGVLSPTTIDGAGTLNVSNSATLTATHIRQSLLTIASGSTVTIADSAAPGTTAATSVLTDLTNSGTLDLKNNDLIVSDTSQFSAVRAAIASAYNGGSWNGTGITSSSAAVKAASYGLGYATTAELSGPSTFDGQNVSAGAVIVKYTLLGDTLLRGTVGGGDYNTVLNNFDATSADWSQGNFHNATSGNEVSGADYNAVLANFDATASGALAHRALKAGKGSPAITPTGSANDIVLNVNTLTGDISMQATTTMGLTLYNIVDASKTLIKTAALLISKTSTNWQVIKNTSSILAEGQNSTTYNSTSPSSFDTIQLTAGQSIDLGDVFNVTSGVKDLTFEFSEPNVSGGDPTTGTTYDGAAVNYVPVPEPTALGMLGLGGIITMRRRGRRATR